MEGEDARRPRGRLSEKGSASPRSRKMRVMTPPDPSRRPREPRCSTRRPDRRSLGAQAIRSQGYRKRAATSREFGLRLREAASGPTRTVTGSRPERRRARPRWSAESGAKCARRNSTCARGVQRVGERGEQGHHRHAGPSALRGGPSPRCAAIAPRARTRRDRGPLSAPSKAARCGPRRTPWPSPRRCPCARLSGSHGECQAVTRTGRKAALFHDARRKLRARDALRFEQQLTTLAVSGEEALARGAAEHRQVSTFLAAHHEEVAVLACEREGRLDPLRPSRRSRRPTGSDSRVSRTVAATAPASGLGSRREPSGSFSLARELAGVQMRTRTIMSPRFDECSRGMPWPRIRKRRFGLRAGRHVRGGRCWTTARPSAAERRHRERRSAPRTRDRRRDARRLRAASLRSG